MATWAVSCDEGEPSSSSPFTCHRCGACCTDLLERGGERTFAELAPGVYRLPGQGGLRLFAWEARAFPEQVLAPLVVAAEPPRDQRVVVAYELRADTCPNFEPEETACTIYEHRPLVCRAFPLLVEADAGSLEVAASSVCGARVPLDTLDAEDPPEAAIARAYPSAFAPALAVPRVLAWVVELLAFLGQAGHVQPEPGLAEAEVLALEDEIPLGDRLEETGIFDGEDPGEHARRIVEGLGERWAPSAEIP